MIHTTDFIADAMYLDRNIARKVAIENQSRFGVVLDSNRNPMVGTFYADAFTDAVKEEQGERSDEIRERRIAELYGNRAT